MADILVFIEHDDDGVTDLTMQCLARGRKLADGSRGTLACIVCGDDVAAITGALTGKGPDTIYTAADSVLAHYLGRPAAKAMAAAVEAAGPALCLLPASTVGNDLAPRLAADLGAGAILDCQDVTVAGATVTGTRMEFDAKALTRYCIEGPAVVTLKDGIEEDAPAGGAGQVAPLTVTLTEDDLKSAVERREVAHKTVNLKDAKVIIGGGAGVGSKENFTLLEQLARATGGEIGATRAAVDAGWVTAERQIGQTGVTVRPDLYIACGISGAVQHCVGIRDAKTIIAINTDPSAPIFKLANYRLVGDLATVIPKLVELLGA